MSSSSTEADGAVLLTGATGYIGGKLLAELPGNREDLGRCLPGQGQRVGDRGEVVGAALT